MTTSSTTTADDGSTIAFSVDGVGPALLLPSGQGTDRRWWDRVVPSLAGRHTVIRADYIGTGASIAAPKAEYSTRRFAGDAIAVLDALGIAAAHVYGTSMGGKVAQWIALDHPERVIKLVLGCTSTGGPPAVLMDPATAEQFGQSGPEGNRARLPLMYTDNWLASHEPNAAVVAAPATQLARIGHRRASKTHDTSALAASITAPTLVLHGTDDAVVPTANGHLLADLIPGATVRVFDGARHAYFEEQIDEASAEVLSFLAG
ncbi:alpha/beta fold hydrolase [Arthrobacter sp. SDTb3-6]|uniref:alpha/beta fold hydrolase n=1 Tax=Arthrobacter sp. SDTb3-6 TaxID=2713571 RepID=UPI00159E2D5C|nr:alpha/beta fold hydrolase [Arthrobacter sp. SDTb3-6]NVM98482.1 alpha/beta fold hydrolase [Arthrobacter sp. SDTb3-6]